MKKSFHHYFPLKNPRAVDMRWTIVGRISAEMLEEAIIDFPPANFLTSKEIFPVERVKFLQGKQIGFDRLLVDKYGRVLSPLDYLFPYEEW